MELKLNKICKVHRSLNAFEELFQQENFYKESLNEVCRLIPKEELKRILSQEYCELDSEFLGFVNVYNALRRIIPQNKIIIDFGCYMASQAYLFKDHAGYIGVDVDEQERFTPTNAKHYVCTIKTFLNKELPKMLETHKIEDFFAICSYVPDFNSTALVKQIFPNSFVYYPE